MINMIRSLTAMLQEHGLYWKESSLEMLTTRPCGSFGIGIQAMNPDDGKEQTMEVRRVAKMTVSGVMLDSRGSTETAIAHNIGAAERAIAAIFEILFNTSESADKRFGEYRKRITPVLLHGCGSWVWTGNWSAGTHLASKEKEG